MIRINITFMKYCSVAIGATACDWLVFITLDLLGVNYILPR
jgi:hypothetical protein